MWAIYSRHWTPQGQSCHTSQEQPAMQLLVTHPGERIGKGEKRQKSPATRHDSKKRILPTLGCPQQVWRGPPVLTRFPPTSSPPTGHGSPGARAEMGKDQITPHREVTSMSLALSLGKKKNMGRNICCSSGLLMARF